MKQDIKKIKKKMRKELKREFKADERKIKDIKKDEKQEDKRREENLEEKQGRIIDKLRFDFDDKIKAYALENAINHEGKSVEGAVLGKLFQEGLKKENIGKIMPLIKQIIKEVNSLGKEEQEKLFSDMNILVKKHEEKEKTLPELENVKGKVVMRLAPFPSGALHIGNAKTYMLNALYCEKYKGRLILVIDDTIGSKEKQIIKEAYQLIPDAFKWLKVRYSKKIYYKSDRLKIYYKYAEQLIKLKKAYVCDCSQERIKEYRERGIECSCRQYDVKTQVKRWKQMFDKKTKQGDFTLRLKTNMQDPNPAFRDRVLFRLSEAEHPRVKKKYKVWPMLEFSWAIDDHLLKITHILRGKDLMIETDMEKYIWDIFKWKHPEVIHAGLVRIEGIKSKISKSKAQKEVKEGIFTGWDDPRTWSIQSLRRRGFLPEAFREFVKEIGLNKQDIAIPIESLYSINRKMIDKNSDRYSFIQEPVKLEIKNKPEIREIQVKVHPEKNTKRKIILGKNIYISNNDFEKFNGKEIRLMHLFNVKLKNKESEFTDSENKDIQKINWVSDFVNVRILMPEGNWVSGIGEMEIKNLKIGKVIQFERFGFVRFDNINSAGEYEFWFTHK